MTDRCQPIQIKRFNRNLKGLDIEDTAIAYLKFAHEA